MKLKWAERGWKKSEWELQRTERGSERRLKRTEREFETS